MNFMTCSDDKNRKFGLNSFKANWFSENGTLAADFASSIEIKNVVHLKKSKYHDILVFDSLKFGRCLALDNGIQCTERDEFTYHEMITFLPLLSHPQPKKVLVIGSGNGGVVREMVKHPSVQSVVLCDIDEAVIRVCKEYLPFMEKGFQSPKLTISTEDGLEYAKSHNGQFDIIVTDLLGPATRLCEKANFEYLKAALRPGGVIAFKGKCYWFDLHKTKEFLNMCHTVFPVVDYASTLIPSLPGGQRGILLCGISPETKFREPLHKLSSQTIKDFGLRYYTPAVHCAAFAHPYSISKELGLKEEVYSI